MLYVCMYIKDLINKLQIFKKNIIVPENNIKLNKKLYNIIIIDDSEITRNLICNIFKNNSKINNISIANDGLDAINKICNNINGYDIVFIDNQMPNLNGIQVIKLLRGINFNKIIFGITGSSNDELIDFNLCGADYVFQKPLNNVKINLLMDFINKDDMSRPNNKKLQIVNAELKWL